MFLASMSIRICNRAIEEIIIYSSNFYNFITITSYLRSKNAQLSGTQVYEGFYGMLLTLFFWWFKRISHFYVWMIHMCCMFQIMTLPKYIRKTKLSFRIFLFWNGTNFHQNSGTFESFDLSDTEEDKMFVALRMKYLQSIDLSLGFSLCNYSSTIKASVKGRSKIIEFEKLLNYRGRWMTPLFWSGECIHLNMDALAHSNANRQDETAQQCSRFTCRLCIAQVNCSICTHAFQL